MHELAERLASLTPEGRSELLAELERRGERFNVFPLSFSQQRLWLLDRLETDSTAYNIPGALSLRGPLAAAALAQSLDEIIRRHEALRTTFADFGGRPLQVVWPPWKASPLPVVDLTGLAEEVRRREVLRLVQRDAAHLFNLDRGPLLRLRLLRLGPEEHVLSLSLHHIVADGWSLGVLVRELAVLYRNLAGGEPSPLPELPLQYADFAAWQRRTLEGAKGERQLAYWKQRLTPLPEALELPLDRERPVEQSFRGHRRPLALPRRVAEAVHALARRHGATAFMTLLAAFFAFVHRYTGRRDLAVGTPVANRNRSEIEGLIGFFVNTLVVRVDVGGEASFNELVERVKEVTLEAYAHQDLPFERLVEALRPDRDLSRNPLFQMLFALQNAPLPPLALEGMEVKVLEIDSGTSRFDLELHLWPAPDGFEGSLIWACDLWEPTTTGRWLRHFGTLLESALESPQQRVAELPLLEPAELHQVLVGWNPGPAPATSLPVHRRMEIWADREPQIEALRWQGGSLSYWELHRRAANLARLLRQRGVDAESVVAIALGRSPEGALAALAVARCGAAFLPLDPEQPRQRLERMLEVAAPRWLLHHRDGPGELPEAAVPRLAWEDVAEAMLQGSEAGAGEEPPQPLDLAFYVLFTSGSTGEPKGVVVTHRTFARLLDWQGQALPGQCRTAWWAAPTFDVSVQEIFSTWAQGGTLILVPESARRDPEAMLDLIEEAQVERLFLPFVALQQLAVAADRRSPAALRRLPLRDVVTAGEQLKITPQLRRLFAALGGARLHNHYGPTEGHVVTALTLEGPPDAWPPLPSIGRPVDGSRIHVLDAHLRPLPPGAVGELVISGESPARGYAGRPALTAERFVPDPFGGRFGCPGARLYRTGDRVRQRSDGALELLGRLDGQVKIRGFRVEPGEVEAVLTAHPAVADAVVAAHRVPSGEATLVAWWVAGGGGAPSGEELRTFLRQRLPSYMVPALLIRLDALPRTSSGKVHRRLLPPPSPTPRETTVGGFRRPSEEILASLWTEVLGPERAAGGLRPEDDFFALGGHSLLATQLMSRVRDALGVELPVRAVFEAPTLAELARRIDAARQGDTSRAAPPMRCEPRPLGKPHRAPLSFAQQRLWFLQQLEPGSPFYNLPGGLRLEGPLLVLALADALAAVVLRHEILRTTFEAATGGPQQVVAPATPAVMPLLAVVDLSGLPAKQVEAELQRQARILADRSFDLSRGPLMRSALLRRDLQEHVLAMVLHHIGADGWSLGVLTRELSELYRCGCRGEPLELPELPVQYPDFAVWQRQWLSGDVLEDQLAYWRRHLEGAPGVLEMPADRPRPRVQSFRGGHVGRALPTETLDALRHFSRDAGATPFVTLLAAFLTLVRRCTGRRDLITGIGIANRNRTEIEGLIGFFVNSLVVRVDFGGDPPFYEAARRVREVVLDTYAHQDLPFEKLVEELAPERDTSRNPLFQIMFALQNAPLPAVELEGVRARPFEVPRDAANFDFGIFVEDRREGWVTIQYSADLFDPTTAQRLLGHYLHLLAGIAADPGRRLSELPLLGRAEQQQLLEWAGGHGPAAAGRLEQRFAAQTRRRPEAVALNCGIENLTTIELARRARRLGGHLRGRGVGRGDVVAVRLPRGIEMVVAVLGILDAGAAYLPIDEHTPSRRQAFMLEDSGARLLLALPETEAAAAVEVVSVCAATAPREDGGEDSDVTAFKGGDDEPAYCIYTSGSTGRPKAVVVTHANVTRLLSATDEAFGFTHDDVWTLFHSFAFDFSVWEIWGALAFGGRLVVVPWEVSRSPEAFHALLVQEGVTVLSQTPSAFRHLMEADATAIAPPSALALRYVVFGGESLEFRSLAPWIERHGDESPRLINMYGITETTVHVTYRRLTAADVAGARGSTIGHGIPDLGVHVLDGLLQPVPMGVPGEICVGGAGLALGYAGRMGLTAERFVPHPWATGERLYRSGDLGRWRPDGDLEYLGRIDQQVKVRGFRVEMGEVESVLVDHPGIQEAVVTVWPDPAGGSRLVAYIVPDNGAAGPLRRLLRLEGEGALPDGSSRFELPNGLTVMHLNRNETEFLYRELFEEGAYLRHGVTLRPGDRVFDVGANIGLASLHLQHTVGGLEIFAFEPVPQAFEVLEANAAIYGFGAGLFRAGLSDRPGEATFDYYPHVSIVSGISGAAEVEQTIRTFVEQELRSGEEGLAPEQLQELLAARLTRKRITVPMTTVSEVLRQRSLDRIDLLKIDVEGGEMAVLAGVEEEHWERIRQVVVEVHDVDGRLAAVTTLLKRHGFQVVTEQEEALRQTALYNLFAVRPGAVPAPAPMPPPPAWCSLERLVGDLRRLLRESLPSYMAPAVYVPVASLPLTPNGKVDRHALPAPNAGAATQGRPWEPPSNETERRVAEIWQQVLRVERVGLNENFFDLGGHSLLLAQVHGRLREAYPDRPVSMVDLFQHSTVASLAERLDGVAAAEPQGSEVGERARGRHTSMARLRRLRRRPSGWETSRAEASEQKPYEPGQPEQVAPS